MRKIKGSPITKECIDVMEMNYHGVENKRNLRQTVNVGMFLSVGKTIRGVFGSKSGDSVVNHINNSLPGKL